jgi:NADH:ubiquinone oxidoreductase subunit H
MKKDMSLEQFVEDISEELYKTFEKQPNDLEDRDKATMLISAGFITAFINTILAKELRNRPDTVENRKELVKFVTTKYSAAKFSILNAVAEGFSKALSEFANRDAIFYCHLEQVNEKFLSDMIH